MFEHEVEDLDKLDKALVCSPRSGDLKESHCVKRRIEHMQGQKNVKHLCLSCIFVKTQIDGFSHAPFSETAASAVCEAAYRSCVCVMDVLLILFQVEM